MSADGDDPSAVNAIEVTTVSAGYDTPVLDVRDGLFDDKAQQPDLRHWRGGERAGTTARSTRQGKPGLECVGSGSTSRTLLACAVLTKQALHG